MKISVKLLLSVVVAFCVADVLFCAAGPYRGRDDGKGDEGKKDDRRRPPSDGSKPRKVPPKFLKGSPTNSSGFGAGQGPSRIQKMKEDVKMMKETAMKLEKSVAAMKSRKGAPNGMNQPQPNPFASQPKPWLRKESKLRPTTKKEDGGKERRPLYDNEYEQYQFIPVSGEQDRNGDAQKPRRNGKNVYTPKPKGHGRKPGKPGQHPPVGTGHGRQGYPPMGPGHGQGYPQMGPGTGGQGNPSMKPGQNAQGYQQKQPDRGRKGYTPDYKGYDRNKNPSMGTGFGTKGRKDDGVGAPPMSETACSCQQDICANIPAPAAEIGNLVCEYHRDSGCTVCIRLMSKDAVPETSHCCSLPKLAEDLQADNPGLFNWLPHYINWFDTSYLKCNVYEEDESAPRTTVNVLDLGGMCDQSPIFRAFQDPKFVAEFYKEQECRVTLRGEACEEEHVDAKDDEKARKGPGLATGIFTGKKKK